MALRHGWYCFKCRSPRSPSGGKLDCTPLTLVIGNLRGLCSTCGTLFYQRVKLAELSEVTAGCDVAFPQGQQRIFDLGPMVAGQMPLPANDTGKPDASDNEKSHRER